MTRLEQVADYIQRHGVLAAVMGNVVVAYVGYTQQTAAGPVSGWERCELATMREARAFLGY